MKVEATDTIPEAPIGFTRDQKELWRVICETLKAVNLLQPIGMHMIEIYCHQYRMYQDAAKAVHASGLLLHYKTKYGEITKKNPHLDIMAGCFKALTSIADRFGFTPLSQSKIKAVADPALFMKKKDSKFNF